MIETSRRSHRNEFPDLIINGDQDIDLILIRKEGGLDYSALFNELCEEFSGDRDLYLYRADKNKINDIEQFYQSLYQFLFGVPLSRDFEMAEMLEILEDEVGESHSCIIAAEDFDDFPAVLKKAFLELIIVTDSFKLLISVDQDFDLKSQSERLWSVLKTRCTEIDFGNTRIFVDDDDADDGRKDEDVFISIDVDEDDFSDDVDEPVQHKRKSESGNISPWYNMIPKLHLLAALFVAVLLLLLWRMDFKAEKVETLEVNFDSKAFVDPLEESIPVENEQVLEADGELLSEYEEQKVLTSAGSEIQVVQMETASQELIVEPKAEVIPKIATPVVKSEVKPELKVAKKKTDWSPYQSDKWISGINKNYFTLQLMASHEEKGIRDFLGKHGVNSQYAVYTTQKDGRDWHVVIYGIYQTREFADEARKNLPPYLKTLNPWIRSMADVQKSIQ